MVYCSKCGIKNPDNAINCSKCGAPLNVTPTPKTGGTGGRKRCTSEDTAAASRGSSSASS